MTGKSIAAYRPEEFEYNARAISCDKLLLALREHHDFSVRRPKGWRPEPKATIQPAKPKRLWVSAVNQEGLRIRDIQGAVADHFELTEADILSTKRRRDFVRPRQIGYYLSKKLAQKSLPEIGRRFGRDHTSVLSGIRVIEALRQTDAKVDADIRAIAELLGGAA